MGMTHKFDTSQMSSIARIGPILAAASEDIADVFIRSKALDAALASVHIPEGQSMLLSDVVAKAHGLEIYIREGAEAYELYVENGGVV